jgi:hypothetical protein
MDIKGQTTQALSQRKGMEGTPILFRHPKSEYIAYFTLENQINEIKQSAIA